MGLTESWYAGSGLSEKGFAKRVGGRRRVAFLELRSGNRIQGAGGGWRAWRWSIEVLAGDLRGGLLVFALLLCGLDECSVGAEFEVGILQGG